MAAVGLKIKKNQTNMIFASLEADMKSVIINAV